MGFLKAHTFYQPSEAPIIPRKKTQWPFVIDCKPQWPFSKFKWLFYPFPEKTETPLLTVKKKRRRKSTTINLNHQWDPATAMATTCTALSVASMAGGARACLFSHLPRTLAKTNISTSIVSSKWIYSSKMGLNPLQRECAINKTVPTRKLQVRAARTESQGVSLGFRAPSFEVSSMFINLVHRRNAK